MAVTAERVVVGTSATALNAASTAGMTLVLQTDATIDLGGPSVADGTGMQLESLDPPLRIELDPGDVLYAATASSANVQVLRT